LDEGDEELELGQGNRGMIREWERGKMEIGQTEFRLARTESTNSGAVLKKHTRAR
jgi:hypothetical protein